MTKIIIFWAIGIIIGFIFTGYGVVGKIRNKHDDLDAAFWCGVGALIVNATNAIFLPLLRNYL